MFTRTILFLAIVMMAFSACNRTISGSKLSQANYDKITSGMSKSQVEQILGPPTRIEDKDFLILKKTTRLRFRVFEGDRPIGRRSDSSTRP